MDQFTLKKIKISDYLNEQCYSFRYKSEDQELLASIKQVGLLQPVIVTKTKNQVISGHKRIYALHALGVESTQALELIAGSELTDKEIFLLALASNFGQKVNELDCLVAVKRATQDFKFNADELMALLQSFNLEPKEHVLKAYLNCLHYPKDLLDLVAKGQLSFKGLDSLSHLSFDELNLLVSKVLKYLSLTVNELKILSDYLGYLIAVERTGVQEFVDQANLQELLARPDLSLKQRGQMLILLVRQQQNPRLSQMERRFSERVSELRCKSLKIKAPEGFEDQGYSLELSLRDKKSLEELKRLISEKEHLLNSLFDIML